MKIVPPKYMSDGFHCPHCGILAHQDWLQLYGQAPRSSFWPIKDGWASQCGHCHEWVIWVNEKIAYPNALGGPPPNPDLSSDIQRDFEEARTILFRSPRGAAALLRLCIQKLCQQLGEPGKDINSDIGNLVKKGLSPLIQQALDVVRVVGNECVHPGEMDLRDDVETAEQLFELVNLIANERITQPKKVQELYAKLPTGKRQGIANRDGATSQPTP